LSEKYLLSKVSGKILVNAANALKPGYELAIGFFTLKE
jgi:hypothetical protein